MRLLLSILIAFSLSTQAVFADDTGSFAIKVFGGTDVEAPSTPTLLSAIPIATDQIDLLWTPVTDNFVVSGYVVFDNGAAIATTTQTSYSDLGLIASSSHTYFIKAFDPSFNYSSSSNILTTTTLDYPPVPTTGSNTHSSTVVRTVLDELQITPGISTSTFYIKTAHPARFELRWGRTTDYELGYIVYDHFVDTYETTLTDLEPSTMYEYEIVGYTPYGNETILKKGQFSTLGFKDIFAPQNVNRFTATADGSNVKLSWQPPQGESYQYVRIVRNHFGFPSYPQDGAVVYQGKGDLFVDKDILNLYSPVYYTAFLVDEAGNVSSGAVAKVFAVGAPGTDDTDSISEGNGTVPHSGPSASTSPSVPAGTRMPDLSEIFLIQADSKQSFADQVLTLDSTTAFVLSIPKEAVSDNLKTIIVRLTDPTNTKQSSSFLLRLNKDKVAYEAVVAALNLEGTSKVIVDVYDYKAAVVGTFGQQIIFKNLSQKNAEIIFKGMSLGDITLLLSLLTLPVLIGILAVFFFYRRKHHGRRY